MIKFFNLFENKLKNFSTLIVPESNARQIFHQANNAQRMARKN